MDLRSSSARSARISRLRFGKKGPSKQVPPVPGLRATLSPRPLLGTHTSLCAFNCTSNLSIPTCPWNLGTWTVVTMVPAGTLVESSKDVLVLKLLTQPPTWGGGRLVCVPPIGQYRSVPPVALRRAQMRLTTKAHQRPPTTELGHFLSSLTTTTTTIRSVIMNNATHSQYTTITPPSVQNVYYESATIHKLLLTGSRSGSGSGEMTRQP